MAKNAVDEKFWAKVVKTDACWIWRGAVRGKGYGVLHRRKFSSAAIGAHRYSWLLARGEIPTGLLVLHKCDIPRCVNPKHLMLGTYKDNVQDMLRKGRENPARGSRQRNAKLTDKKVLRIRRLVASGMTQKKASDLYKVRPHTVNVIISRKTWKHI